MNIIFTAHNCNISFIEKELRYLLNHPKIDSLSIYTDFPILANDITLHEKCSVKIFNTSRVTRLKVKLMPLIFQEVLFNLIWYFRQWQWLEEFLRVRDHLKKANQILTGGVNKEDIFYSYWTGSEAFILSSLKLSGLPNLTISRLHGFDLYLEGNNKGHIPWRRFIFDKFDFLLPISQNGANYLFNNYSFIDFSKIKIFYLGVDVANKNINLCIATSKNYNVVSCGRVGKHKNLKSIFDSLKAEDKLQWTHIGYGEYLEDLKKNVKGNCALKVNFLGKLSQTEIIEYYSNNPILCFISLSPSEGLPVSMMEAMAHGIPVVSTDVGGCSEIVNENTGVLLPKNYTDEDVRKAVYLCAEKFSSREARQKIQDFIKENFDAEKNYGKFVDFLEAENKKHHEKL